jgi:hypothetical protein
VDFLPRRQRRAIPLVASPIESLLAFGTCTGPARTSAGRQLRPIRRRARPAKCHRGGWWLPTSRLGPKTLLITLHSATSHFARSGHRQFNPTSQPGCRTLSAGGMRSAMCMEVSIPNPNIGAPCRSSRLLDRHADLLRECKARPRSQGIRAVSTLVND